MGGAVNEATFPLPCLRQACLQLIEGLNNRLQFPRLTNRIQSPLAKGIGTEEGKLNCQRLQGLNQATP